ncbi:hypothetical protein F5J12DRAFT_784511 [Pisolithus orientalis]|uniref:uncharacterized protein n=1 Tax=Pisolithus orientalis TaxID=936130 RepID=UPI0022249D3D|nr:uncharacterized protein F5J12DRAFT_784511 [Pisolithus orientalis]KAI6000207.1 hypothetical protein F5J12DRAFT_784511 [Pisolithus orientalis]
MPGPLPLPCLLLPSLLLLTFMDQDQLQPLEERTLHIQIAWSVHHPGPPNLPGEDGRPGTTNYLQQRELPHSLTAQNHYYPVFDGSQAPGMPTPAIMHDFSVSACANKSAQSDAGIAGVELDNNHWQDDAIAPMTIAHPLMTPSLLACNHLSSPVATVTIDSLLGLVTDRPEFPPVTDFLYDCMDNVNIKDGDEGYGFVATDQSRVPGFHDNDAGLADSSRNPDVTCPIKSGPYGSDICNRKESSGGPSPSPQPGTVSIDLLPLFSTDKFQVANFHDEHVMEYGDDDDDDDEGYGSAAADKSQVPGSHNDHAMECGHNNVDTKDYNEDWRGYVADCDGEDGPVSFRGHTSENPGDVALEQLLGGDHGAMEKLSPAPKGLSMVTPANPMLNPEEEQVGLAPWVRHLDTRINVVQENVWQHAVHLLGCGGPTAEDFHLDSQGLLSSDWNKHATEVFASHFFECGWYGSPNKSIIKKVFCTHLHTLCAQYMDLQANSDPDDKQLQIQHDKEKENARDQRCHSFNVNGQTKHGACPHTWVPSHWVESAGLAVPGLLSNFYDRTWLLNLDDDDKRWIYHTWRLFEGSGEIQGHEREEACK